MTTSHFSDRHTPVFASKSFQEPVHIIGCGGLGSHIATALVRMGVGRAHSPLFLYDFDRFETHNLANQFVNHSEIGNFKAAAVRRSILAINPEAQVVDHDEMITGPTPMSGVVFVCVDSMSARSTIMKTCLEGKRDITCVIEMRMDSETGISHCFDPHNLRHCDCWWEQCYTDAESDSMTGCGGHFSIISAVYGTCKIALKQFEMFAHLGSPYGMPNRWYEDFDVPRVIATEWPTAEQWD